MPHDYYIRVGEKISKALSADEVQRLYKVGRIPADAMLSRDGKRWTPISDLIKAKTTSLAASPTSISPPPIDRKTEDYVTELTECACGWKRQVETRREDIGAITRCPNCGRLVAVSQLAKPEETRQEPQIHSALDTTPPAKPTVDAAVSLPDAAAITSSYFEVRDRTGKMIRYDTLDDIRNALLSGTITRLDQAREIYPQPMTDDFAYLYDDEDKKKARYEEALEKWKKKKMWRPIGDGIAKEEVTIKVLYQPFAVYAHTGGMLGFLAGFLLTILYCIILVICGVTGVYNDSTVASADKPVESSVQRPSQRPFTPGYPGLGATLHALEYALEHPSEISPEARMILAPIMVVVVVVMVGGVGFVLASITGFVFGYPIGACAGAALYFVRRDSLPRPPADDYRYVSPLATDFPDFARALKWVERKIGNKYSS